MKRRWASFGTLAVLFAVLCFPLIFSSRRTNYETDERNWHLPATRQIRTHWPALDLRLDSLSATAPGYHYFLATASLVTGTSRVALRLVTWAVSLALLFLLWRLFPLSANRWALAAILPLACSNFFVKSASWVVTDNAGLLCAAAVLAAVFFARHSRAGWIAGIAGGAATFVRQLHIWTAVPTALVGFHATSRSKGWWRRVWLLFPVAIPFAVLAILAWRWHGLVPPAWQTYQTSAGFGETASLCFIAALFLLLALPYRCALRGPKIDLGRWEIVGAVAGLLLATIGPTSLDPAAGRWSGYFWPIVGHLSVIANRSIVFLVLAPLGGALFVEMTRLLAREAGRFEATTWLLSFLAWAATFLPNRFVYQRYFEPMILVFLVVWLALIRRNRNADEGLRRGWLPALAAVQLALTLATAHYQTLAAGVTAG